MYRCLYLGKIPRADAAPFQINDFKIYITVLCGKRLIQHPRFIFVELFPPFIKFIF